LILLEGGLYANDWSAFGEFVSILTNLPLHSLTYLNITTLSLLMIC
jgi:hypothetical protein